MIITLEIESEIPLYEQLRNQIVIGIATGRLLPHERLPTVRQLAGELGINAMTVNKAYAILKQEGYIVIDRRHGAKVNPQITRSRDFDDRLKKKLRLLIAEAVTHGLDHRDYEALSSEVFTEMNVQA